MASRFSRAYGKKILETIIAGTDLYVALLEVEATGEETGTTIKEVKWTGYERITVEKAHWSTPTEGTTCETHNTVAIEAKYTSGEGKVVGVAICTAATLGEVIISGALTEELTVNASHSPLKFEAEQLKIEVTSS